MAPKYHGYSILAQTYEFYPHLVQLDIFDVTLSHMNDSKCIAFHFTDSLSTKPDNETNHGGGKYKIAAGL